MSSSLGVAHPKLTRPHKGYSEDSPRLYLRLTGVVGLGLSDLFPTSSLKFLAASPITAHVDLVLTRFWLDQASYGATVYVNLGAFPEVLCRIEMKAAFTRRHFTAGVGIHT
jgi:hypothetical protein